MTDNDPGGMPDYLRTLADEVYEARSSCIRLCREVDTKVGVMLGPGFEGIRLAVFINMLLWAVITHTFPAFTFLG